MAEERNANVYEELEGKLKPNDTDPKVVLKAIDDAISDYNKKRNIPKYETIAPQKVRILNELKKQIEVTPAIIHQHATAYVEIARQKRIEDEKQIRKYGNLFVQNNEILQASLTELAKKYKRSEDEILTILGVKRKKEKDFKDDGVVEMDARKMESIANNLAVLDKKDLYEFLGLTSKASLKECQRKRDEESNAVSRGIPNGEEYNARHALVQFCNEIFIDTQSRRRYDKALENKGFANIRQAIESMARAKTRYISPEHFRKLLETCLENQLTKENAKFLIYTTAKKHGIEVDEGAVASMVTCRFCNRLNIPTDKNCCSCGRPLKVVCPKCQNDVAPEEETCTNCGLSIIGMMDAEKPPTGLKAKINGRKVRLEWQPIDNKDISYIAVRKERSQPINLEDGVKFDETKNSSFEDDTAIPGISYYYAVYSKWCNNHSSSPAQMDAPVMPIAELNGTDISIQIQEPSLKFIFPFTNGLDAVEVMRDGKIVNTHAANIFIDNGLQLGKSYNYCFKAIYKDSEGFLHKSPNGLYMPLTLVHMPKPVNLIVKDGEKEAILTWNAPPTVLVQIYSSDTPFKQNENDLIHIDTFRASPQKSIGNSCVITKDYSGERYFLPVTIVGNLGVVGKVETLTSLAQVSDVSITRDGQVVKVEWKWGALQAVRIIYSIDGNKDNNIENIEKSKYLTPQFLISVPIEAKSVKVEIMPRVETKTGKVLFGNSFIEVVNLRPTTIRFKSVINKKKYYVLPSDNYILHFRCDALLPCSLHLLITEGAAPINLSAKKPNVVISKDKIAPNREVKIPFCYHRKKKGQAIYFRLIAADNNKVKEIVVRPDTLIIK